MTSAKFSDNVYALCLAPGDQIVDSIAQFCSDHAITNAQITGLGSIEDPLVAHYSIQTRQFTRKELKGIFEITALSGNVGLIDGQPAPHLHVSFSDNQMNSFGGHLLAGTCSATAEIIVTAYPSQFIKQPNEEIGLSVWSFNE